MADAFSAPFQIGDVKWLPVHQPTQVTLPCPVCAGARAVTVVLGDGERVGVLCEACGKGFDGPRGIIQEWEYAPAAARFEIARVRSMHDDRWSVESTTGGYADFNELVDTESEALAISTRKCAEQFESNMRSRQRKRKDVANATWSIRYHREQIADLQRQIRWHESRLPKTEAK